ncbi:YXYXY domain-containing protein [Kordia periserrulae]|uniref:YXYXY domain-containing protein n=1 Tax=Kordia periserrulae TaxID=701523 RepID=A0A2T6BZS1_9FLAO|nr:triple tyrosine motif-containing protein [Kordia periserrulae]PTX61556.1 YXYXY domain-containing protein [Kordia periserrulae]
MRTLVKALLVLFISCSFAQELPPIIKYTPKTYNAGNQNWMISQSDDAYMYVANNQGLLEFNGAQWKLYKSPNETIMRSVKVIGNRVYTGCYMNFGYWERNAAGTLEYTSLSDVLQVDMKEDEQFWQIIQLDKWVLFQSLDRIYTYHTEDNSLKVINATNTITKLYKIQDELLFQVLGEGLYSIENGEKVLVTNDAILQNSRVVGIFPKNNQKIIITRDSGWFTLDKNELTALQLPYHADTTQKSIYTSMQLADGSFVLGTIAKGIFLISPEGTLRYHIDQEKGLSDNTALSLFEDVEGNLWVGLDDGINCINTKEPFKYYADQTGRLGTIYASIIHEDYVYLGTNQGLFYKSVNSTNDFEFIAGTKGQVWCLRIIDGELFCGHDTGTFLIKGNTQKQIGTIQGTWDIKKIPGVNNKIIQGNYDGLYILSRQNDTWQLDYKLKGFDISSKHFEWATPTKILVNHEYKGVYELTLDENYQEVVSFTKNTDIEKSANTSLVTFDGNIYQANKNGIFNYDIASGSFQKNAALSAIFENDAYTSGKLVVDDVGYLWAFTNNYINYVTKEKINGDFKIQRIAIPQSLRNEMKGYENISHIKGKTYLLGTSNGYITIDLGEIASKKYEIHINSVSNRTLTGAERQIALQAEDQEFNANENYLAFSYSIPAYNKYEVAEYSYQLEGLYNKWSDWSTQSQISYENLPHGSYKFKVKARINNEVTENTATYSFTINHPWYLSNVAIAIYAILTILLFAAINSFYKRYYKKQRERLLEKKTRELALKELEAQKEIVELKNTQLNSDIEAKNRELAIATMNMIKKNETLNNIKQELQKQKTEQQDVKPVIRLIDKNINNAEDWKFFEEAFNHADKDFFKKVKELHPQLTANDLRLCAYLRLNLSSKEIAPLLNISVRSVEIKRYRLRKKISLAREINLNDYFLNL